MKNVIRLSGPKQQPDTHLKQPVRYLRRRCEPSSPQQTRNEQRYHRQGRSGGLQSLRYRCIAMLRLMCRILPAFRKAMPEEKLERNTSLVGLQAGATYQPGSATQSPAWSPPITMSLHILQLPRPTTGEVIVHGDSSYGTRYTAQQPSTLAVWHHSFANRTKSNTPHGPSYIV